MLQNKYERLSREQRKRSSHKATVTVIKHLSPAYKQCGRSSRCQTQTISLSQKLTRSLIVRDPQRRALINSYIILGS